MKLFFMAVIVALSGALWAQNVGPKSVSTDAAAEIRALENAFDEAIVRRDVSALDKLTSDDFELISLDGNLHEKSGGAQILFHSRLRVRNEKNGKI